MVLALSALLPAVVSAQTIGAKQQEGIVERIAREVRGGYVFPNVGQLVSDSLLARRARGAYTTPLGARDFATRLTTEVRALTKDKHMSVVPPGSADAIEPSAPRRPRALIDSISVVDGLGYIRIGSFTGSDASERFAAAMSRFAATYALIIDLRGCPGGSVDAFMNLASYFVPPNTIFGTLYSRQDNTSTVFRTEHPSGGPYLDRPVFVLTDRATFSAAEAFAYHLKHEGRVRVIGDTSGGGAHRVRRVGVGEGFALSLAFTRVVNAKTGTDWEGVGVIPDVAVPAARADTVARSLARQARPVR